MENVITVGIVTLTLYPVASGLVSSAGRYIYSSVVLSGSSNWLLKYNVYFLSQFLIRSREIASCPNPFSYLLLVSFQCIYLYPELVLVLSLIRAQYCIA